MDVELGLDRLDTDGPSGVSVRLHPEQARVRSSQNGRAMAGVHHLAIPGEIRRPASRETRGPNEESASSVYSKADSEHRAD